MRFFCLILFVFFHSAMGLSIHHYRSIDAWAKVLTTAKEVILLREFIQDQQKFYLAIDPIDLTTTVYPLNRLEVHWNDSLFIRNRFINSPYLHILHRVSRTENIMQDAGIQNIPIQNQGLFLTVDLCPSHRSLDKKLFTNVIKQVGPQSYPIPISISISGMWIKKHLQDLNWLDSLAQEGILNINWMNHSFSHYTQKNVPLQQNFMLNPSVNPLNEILKNEQYLLEHNITPSVFFRFPGLVSNTKLFDEVLKLGLIPVGTDAWLAKGQKPQKGSIILVHGNGNEPYGAYMLKKMLKSKIVEFRSKKWSFIDLKRGLSDFYTPK